VRLCGSARCSQQPPDRNPPPALALQALPPPSPKKRAHTLSCTRVAQLRATHEAGARWEARAEQNTGTGGAVQATKQVRAVSAAKAPFE